MRLPHELVVRPHTQADAHASFELIARAELHDLGAVEIDEEDVAAELRRPSLDPFRDTVGVWSGPTLVADAYMLARSRADVVVDPAWRGRGIGTWLRTWTEGRARETGAERVRQIVADVCVGAVALLTDAGYAPGSTAWILRIDHHAEPDGVDPPEGVSIRAFDPGRDDRAAYRVIEDAFSAFPDRDPLSFDDWAETTIRRSDFDPDSFLLAVAGEQVVGAALGFSFAGEGWVEELAVADPYRNRGIARALLHASFRQAWARGERMSGLSTNSDTGALALYEKVGMRVRRSYTTYVLEL